MKNTAFRYLPGMDFLLEACALQHTRYSQCAINKALK